MILEVCYSTLQNSVSFKQPAILTLENTSSNCVVMAHGSKVTGQTHQKYFNYAWFEFENYVNRIVPTPDRGLRLNHLKYAHGDDSVVHRKR